MATWYGVFVMVVIVTSLVPNLLGVTLILTSWVVNLEMHRSIAPLCQADVSLLPLYLRYDALV